MSHCVAADFRYYRPMQDIAPRAVRIADAIDAMICTIHLRVSWSHDELLTWIFAELNFAALCNYFNSHNLI